ncbi:MAG TPA: type II secretion system F family protein [Gaiellaceae bacterium]
MLILLVGLFLAGAAVYLVAKAVAWPRMRTAETIAQIDSYGYSRSHGDAKEQTAVRGAVDDIAGAIGGVIGKRFSSLREEELRNRLMSAGLYTTAPRKFLGYQTLAAVTFPAAWIWFAGTAGFSGLFVIFGGIASVFLGWKAPLVIVDRRARRRMEDIDHELPELIDILVVAVEAGLGFSGSLQTASERLEGPLGDELRLALQQQNMGLSTPEALQNMLARADTPAMRSFVRAVTQGETLGVSIGEILRSLAIEMRKRRRADAEERAQKAPIKILFPLVFLIFPAMFVILLGPAIFDFIDAFHGR